MLSLQLKSGEYVTIGEEIAVQVFKQSGDSFHVAVKAPREVPILRGKVLERTERRPDGLYRRPPQSPSEQRHNAKRLEAWTLKKAMREQIRAAAMEDLLEVAQYIEDLAVARSCCVERQRLSGLGVRITKAVSVLNSTGGGM